MVTLTLIQGVLNTFVIIPVAGRRLPRGPAAAQERARLRTGYWSRLSSRSWFSLAGRHDRRLFSRWREFPRGPGGAAWRAARR